MNDWIPERLGGLLGDSLQQITADHLDRLIGEELTEQGDLEYKELSWPKGTVRQKGKPDPNIELARDLAQFANANGGLIIVGAVESETSPGTLLNFNPLSCAAELCERVENVASKRIFPRIDFALHTVRYGDGDIVLISIPPGDKKPYSVQEKSTPCYTYPVRGTKTRQYLSENEVSEYYRLRFDRQRDQLDHLNCVLDSGTQAARALPGRFWNESSGAKLVIASLPRTLGNLELNSELLAVYATWIKEAEAWMPPLRRPLHWTEAFPDVEAIRLGTRAERDELFSTGKADCHAASLRLDGSGWVVLDITSFVASRRVRDSEVPRATAVAYTLNLVSSLPIGLRLLAEHGTRVGASDVLHLAVQIVGSGSDEMDVALAICPARWYFTPRYVRVASKSLPIYRFASSEILRSPMQQLLSESYALGRDLVRGFEIIEPPEITSAGQLVPSKLPRKVHGEFILWAKNNGVPIID